ncbi:SGNH/GDSL hydrolase family protein [Paludisphaera borealis]|uniref:SGNH hydrolase-type esterase domain-containing protein n=1 Tax=Paludisphaera borealis TaxID=1387353 RepID=A0A1U7CUU3_9BACT|nr:SGNH/GDSL hydrolase family protein [Paludisphaera borealis]APW62717.1 hypothetical protein BSF38_04269 [Paludisphaera borealis]
MARFFSMRRPARADQRVLGGVERSRRLQRRFKLGIVVATLIVVAGILAAVPRGRHLVASVADRARQSARWAVGLPVPREEVDARHERDRRQAVDDAARKFRDAFPTMDEPIQRLFRYAGSDPDAGLLRWGNFDQTLLLPSTVFEPDDAGRSYCLKPNTRSIWVRNVSPKGSPLTFLIVPDRPELAEVLQGTGGIIVTTSVQTTNSWGLRGPEPDPSAPLRGIVLGDSYMQGMFIDDDHTPPECLRRYLENHEKTGVSILNTGCLGYSPEQYYYSLLKFADRFKPQFVVMSVFANDFGGILEVARGKGDWDEGRYWLGEIQQVCRSRGLLLLVVPAPLDSQMNSARFAGYYPGLISNILNGSSEAYLDPTEEFINRNIAMILEGDRAGNRPTGSPLYNNAIGDGHFSPAGAEVWAEAVGRRLVLLLDKARGARRPSP